MGGIALFLLGLLAFLTFRHGIVMGCLTWILLIGLFGIFGGVIIESIEGGNK